MRRVLKIVLVITVVCGVAIGGWALGRTNQATEIAPAAPEQSVETSIDVIEQEAAVQEFLREWQVDMQLLKTVAEGGRELTESLKRVEDHVLKPAVEAAKAHNPN